MKTQIVSESFDMLEDIEEEVDYIKKKDFSNLKINIELDMNELNELLGHIIFKDTQIHLPDYDIFLEEDCGLSDLIEEIDIEEDEEYKYVKDTLCKKYSPGIMNDISQYVLQYTCEHEHFYKREDDYGESCLIFAIDVDSFNDKDSLIVKYIKELSL